MPWRGPEYDGEFPSLGWEVLDWWTEYLRVPNGPLWGEPFVPTDEQRRYIVRFYRLDPKSGRFVYRRAAKREPKGKGKSPEAAALAVSEFAGPVCFDGWDANGEPVGKPHPTPWVQVAACSEDQTANTYSHLFEMLRDSPAVDEFGIDLGRTRVQFHRRPGLIEGVTSSAGSREGQPVTFAVLDETHLWTPANGGKRLAATIRRNVAKMNGRTVETTNAYVPGELSVAEATHRAAEKGEKGLLHVATEGPWVEDLTDRKALKAALRVAYGDAHWIDLDRIVEEIQDPATDAADARRYYLNQVVKGESKAVDPKRWAELTVSRVVADGERIGVGFDGSISEDATALVACTADGHLFVPVVNGRPTIWERPVNAPPDWKIPRLEVENAVEQVFATYDVGRMLCDPPKWQTEIERWMERWNAGRTADDTVVLFFDTNQPRRMAPACDRFTVALNERAVTHDGDSLLTSHVLAMARKKVRVRDEDDDGRTRYVFTKDADGRKIDAGIAAVLAEEAAMTMPEAAPRYMGPLVSFR